MEYQTAESGTGSCCYTRSGKQKYVGHMAWYAKDYHQDGIALENSKDLKKGVGKVKEWPKGPLAIGCGLLPWYNVVITSTRAKALRW